MNNARGRQIELLLNADSESDRERWLSALRPPAVRISSLNSIIHIFKKINISVGDSMALFLTDLTITG